MADETTSAPETSREIRSYDPFELATGGRFKMAAVQNSAEPAEAVAAEPVVEPETEQTPLAEVPEITAEAAPVEPEPVAEPTVDPRVAELESRLAEQDLELGKLRNVEQQKQFNAQMVELRDLATSIKADYGEETSLGKFGDKMVAMLDSLSQKADAAVSSTVERDNYQMHKQAMSDSPIVKAVYNAIETNPKNADANMHLQFVTAISAALNADPKTAKLNQADHYREIEKRLEAEMPGLKSRYYPGPKTVPAAAAPVVKPPVVTTPTTVSGIPGGTSPMPSKPLDISKMSVVEKAQFASRATEPQMNFLRAQRARQ